MLGDKGQHCRHEQQEKRRQNRGNDGSLIVRRDVIAKGFIPDSRLKRKML